MSNVVAWLREEPVRVYLYSALTAILAILITTGVISGDQQNLWLALLAAVLGVPGTEGLRSRVSPVESDSGSEAPQE